MPQTRISWCEKLLKAPLHAVYFINVFRSSPSAMLIRFTSSGGLGRGQNYCVIVMRSRRTGHEDQKEAGRRMSLAMPGKGNRRMRFLGVISICISDPRSVGSWCIKARHLRSRWIRDQSRVIVSFWCTVIWWVSWIILIQISLPSSPPKKVKERELSYWRKTK